MTTTDHADTALCTACDSLRDRTVDDGFHVTYCGCGAKLPAGTLSLAALVAMRGWVADCVWADVEDVDDLTDTAIVRGVERHYAGGIAAFIADAI